MKFFRNTDLKYILLLQFLIMFTAFGAAFYFLGALSALWILALSLLYISIHFISDYKRYQKIAILNHQLDAILHDEAHNIFSNCNEGELAILHSQLTKLLLRLHDQADDLKNDKLLLATALADISHQMKTPLTSIHLLLSFLNEDAVTADRRREIAREISTLLDRIDWLVYALLKISRLDAGTADLEKKQVSVQELLNKSYALIAIPMDIKNISWTCNANESVTYTGDLSWSIEAISNILKNCMESCSEGGCICVATAQNPLYTQIIITDTGSGISAEDLPHLFERFYRGKESDSHSVGIGLSLAQKIINAQNGTIKASNAKQGGAQFEIRFYHSTI